MLDCILVLYNWFIMMHIGGSTFCLFDILDSQTDNKVVGLSDHLRYKVKFDWSIVCVSSQSELV